MSSLRDWILELPGQGRFTFTTAEARARQAGVSAAATAAALDRAKADHIIVSPVRGFHVVLPLEDRAAGAPSWRLFLDSLMTYLDTPYYVGLLTAAAIHGASPQAAQAVQVVTPRARRPIRVGRLAIVFVVRRSAAQAPVEQITTPSGRIRVASPELVGLDLVRYQTRAGGIDNVLTVLRDLSPSMRRTGMRKALVVGPSAPDLQRLAFLLTCVDADNVATVIADELKERRTTWVRLSQGSPCQPQHDAISGGGLSSMSSR